MNHGFFNTAQKVSANPCTERDPVHQSKKKARQSKSKFKATMIVFSTSEGLFRWIGCLKFRPLTRSIARRSWQTFLNGWEEDLKYWRMTHRFFTNTTRRHTKNCLTRLFDEAQDHLVGTSAVLTWPNTMWLFFYFQRPGTKGTRFESASVVKTKAMGLMNKLSDDVLQHFFQKWKIRIERCRDRGGKYIQSDNILLCYSLNHKFSNISPVIL